jgi:peptide/nickel transport system substrate-binding protein
MSEDTVQGGVDNLVSDYLARRIGRRDFVRQAVILGLSLSSAAAILAACSTSNSSSSSANVQTGGTFIEGYDRDFTKMDTVLSGWADPGYVALYEFTMIRDFQGKIVPALFESWTVSSDKLTWTCKVRDGVKFHSGAPCTNANVVEDFNLFRNPKIGQNQVFWANVTDVSAGAGNTVEIKLSKPWAAIGETLATEYSMIHNNAARVSAGDSYGATTVDGTGPFKLQEFTPGKQVIVARNEAYAGTVIPFLANKGKAYVDAVKWVPITEPANRANEIEAGTVMAAKNPAGQDVDRLKANSSLIVQEWASTSNQFIALNLAKTNLGFDQLDVRQAISHAIDREGIVKSVFFGHAVATYGPLNPNFKWYEKGVEKFNQYDPEKAKSLLDGAGWTVGSSGVRQKGGQKLSFTYYNWAQQSDGAPIMEAVAASLAKVGVDMKVVSLESASFFPHWNDTAESFGYEWLWSSPIDVLVIFATIPSKTYNGNMTDLQAAFAAWQSAGSDAELEAAARQAQLIWAEKLPKIPVVTPNVVWVQNKKVHGWKPNQAMLYPLYNDVWFEH